MVDQWHCSLWTGRGEEEKREPVEMAKDFHFQILAVYVLVK